MANEQPAWLLRHLRKLVPDPEAGRQSDRQLLQQFLATQDEAAFAVLARRHGSMVSAVCQSVLHHEQDAQDASQAAFLVLARKAGSIRKQESVGSWLHGVAYRLALKAKKQAAKRRSHEHLGGMLSRPEDSGSMARVLEGPQKDGIPPSSSPMDDLTWRELREVLHEELSRLPEKNRLPLVLCYLEGMTQEEAARQLSWTPATVKGRLDRGRHLLRARLTRRGLTLSIPLLATALSRDAALASSPTWLKTTVQAAVLFARGESAAVLSTQAVTWAQTALKALTVGKFKIAAMLMLAFGALAAGTGVAVYKLSVTDQPKTQRHKLEAKGMIAPEQGQTQPARLDQFGDPLPAEAIARLGTARFRHGELVSYMAFSPDAKQLISQSDIVRVWETATGKELRHFTPLPGHKLGAGSLSPDGKVLAVGDLMSGSDPIVLWEVATGRKLKEFGKGWYELVTFSPDGKTLAAIASRRGRIELWVVATGQRLHEWEAHGQAYAVAFASDGKTLLTSGRDKRVCFWDVATGRQTGEIKDCPTVWKPFGPAQMSLSPDGSRLAAIRPKEDNQLMPINQIGIWDVATGKEVCQLSAPKEEIAAACWSGFWAVAWAANGELVTAGPDESVRIWDLVAARPVRRLRNASPYSLAVSGDGKHIAAGGESIRVIDLAKDPDFFPDLGGPGPSGVLSVNGGIAVTSDSALVLWDAATGKELRRLSGHPSGIATVHASADGRILFAVCGDHIVRAWDTATGQEKRDLELKKANLHAQDLALAPDGKLLLAAAASDGEIGVFNVLTGKKVQNFRGHQSDIYGLAFTPEARTLVVCSGNRTAEVWDVATGKKLRQFSLPKDDERDRPAFEAVFTAALSPDGKLLAFGSQSRFLVLKDLITGQDVRRLDELPDGVCPLAFSPDGKTLAWAGWMISNPGWKDPAVHLVEVLTGRERHTLSGHGGRVVRMAFSADGKRLISASSDTTALIWDLSGKLSAGERGPLSAKEIEAAWADLASDDAARAYRAIGRFSGSPNEAVSFMQKCLQPVAKVDETRLSRLIADLDSNTFSVREGAMKELEKLGDLAAPACRKALEQKPSAEARRRLEALLQNQDRQVCNPSADRLRTLRGTEVLEHIGSPEAKQVLKALAQGAPQARLTHEAAASLQRLNRRAAAEK